MPKANFHAGFTLIEMLISMFIAGILLSVLYSFFNTSLDSVSVIRTQNQLLSDTRTAGNFVADTMNSAVYIYPPNIKLTLTAANAYATQHNGTSTVWTVRTDPFVAGLLPPVNRAVKCVVAIPYNAASPGDSQGGCYKVVAFYAKSRAEYVAAAPTLANPGSDNTIAATAQVLMYYWAYVNPDTNTGIPWPTSGFTGRATLLADALTATGMTFEDSANWKCTDPSTGGVGNTAGAFLLCSDSTITALNVSNTNAIRKVSATQLSLTLQTSALRKGATNVSSGLRFWLAPRNVGLGAQQ